MSMGTLFLVGTCPHQCCSRLQVRGDALVGYGALTWLCCPCLLQHLCRTARMIGMSPLSAQYCAGAHVLPQAPTSAELYNDATTPVPQLYRAWPGAVLAPGEVLRLPLLLHAHDPGALCVQMLWCCEPKVCAAAVL